MSPKTNRTLYRLALLSLTAAALVAAGCGSGSLNTATTTGGQTGSSFVVGTDAPMASVVSFNVQIASLVANPTGGGSPVSLISGAPTVDFARFNGLQTLLDMNDVAVGTYDSVTITLGTGTIGYLATGSGAPSIQTMPATYATNSNPVTVTLTNPLVVKNSSAPVGLRIDFDLAQSIGVDSSGAITGTVTPTFDMTAVKNNDKGGYIDSLVGGVTTVGTQSFTIQGPHGEAFTIDVSGTTQWDNGASLSSLNTNSIVEVTGKIDPADQTLDADQVAILTDSNFYATGQITYVTPSSGAATSFDLYTRALEPTSIPLTLGQIATVNLTGSEKYYIYAWDNPFTQFFFNANSLVAGQDVAIGGPDSGVVSESNVGVKRIHLRAWGFNGTVVPGSEDPGQNSFQMKVTGFAGVLIPETITVYLGPNWSDFRYGLGDFSGITDGEKVRVVGLLLKDPTSGNVVLLARHVDGRSFDDLTTASF